MSTYNNYIDDITKIGRATMLFGLFASFVPPLILTFYFGFNPGFAAVMTGFASIASVMAAFWVSEPLSYYPIVGRAGLYIGFLSGNLANMRVPAAITAQESTGRQAGTDKGAIIGTIGMGVSTWVNVAILLIAVVLGQALLAKMPPSFKELLNLIIPTLFGAIFMQIGMKAPKVGVFAVIAATVISQLVGFIPGKPSYLITLATVFVTIYFALKTMAPKEEK